MQFSSCTPPAGAIVFILLAGCARLQPTTAVAQGPQEDGRYECLRTPQAQESGTPQRRNVIVRFDAATQSTVLTLAGERRQVLGAMSGSAGGLYANDFYAWRADAASAVLTDVDRVATYECRRTGIASAARAAPKTAA